MEEFVPHFGVFFFIVGGFVEDFGDLFVAVFFGAGGVELVFYAGLGLAGEGGF